MSQKHPPDPKTPEDMLNYLQAHGTPLNKFKKGIRGTNPRDTTGATMRPMSMILADEQAMKNVVAHISTLAK